MILRFFPTLFSALFPLRPRVRQILAALTLGALLTAGAASGARALLRPDPEDWVCSEFCRTAQESEKVRSLERAFRKGCSPECARLCATQEEVRALMQRARTLTPEIKAALEAAAHARSAAALAVLEHVYAVAEALPADRREDYLRAVLPSVAECCCTP
jgi:hypothetical protein